MDRPTRILFVQPVAERGGSDWALLRMVRSLPRDRYECHVAQPAVGPLGPALAAAGATVHVVPMRRITSGGGLGWWIRYAFGWPLAVWRLVRLIRGIDADIVDTNSLHSWYGWAAAAVSRRPHVWHAREITVQSGAARALEHFLCAHFATVVVAMSEAIASQLDRRNVRVIIDDVEAGVFGPLRAVRFRRTCAIPDDAALVAGAGRIDTWKGFDVLLDAWPLIKAKRPDAHLVVAGPAVSGKEEYESALAARAASLADVHWVGPRSDIADLYADSDVFVLASTEPEPFGLVVIEALASGCPVVVTDHGGAPETLERCPGGGLKVPPNNPEALAFAVCELLPETSSTTGRLRRDTLWHPQVPRFDVVYDEIISACR